MTGKPHSQDNVRQARRSEEHWPWLIAKLPSWPAQFTGLCICRVTSSRSRDDGHQATDSSTGSRVAFSSISRRSLAVSFSGAFRTFVWGERTERPSK
jgi:hypothetical protein